MVQTVDRERRKEILLSDDLNPQAVFPFLPVGIWGAHVEAYFPLSITKLPEKLRRNIAFYTAVVSRQKNLCLVNCISLRWSRGSVLAFSTQVRGFKPGQSRWIF